MPQGRPESAGDGGEAQPAADLAVDQYDYPIWLGEAVGYMAVLPICRRRGVTACPR